MPKVCLIRCGNYDRDQVQLAISTAFKEFGAEALFHPGEKILLKPNLLSSYAPERAVTTHPEVFRAVASAMQEYQVELSYGDSPASDSPSKAQRICGMEQVAQELHIPEADFVTSVPRDFPKGRIARKFHLAQAVLDNDGIISISKFKTHALTRFTGALKNQYGLIPGTVKARNHVQYPTEEAFTQMIADLNLCVRPRLFVMDAIVGMEGNGPSNGTPRKLGMLLVSDDPVALDSVCISMIGMDFHTLPLVKNAEQIGVGVADLEKIDFCLIETVDGEQKVRWDRADKMVPLVRIPDFVNSLRSMSALGILNTLLGPVTKRYVQNRPAVIYDNCTKCRHCVRMCPVTPKAIEFSEKKQKIVYHYERCIRCYCCQELCPYAAIVVEKAPLSFLMKGK